MPRKKVVAKARKGFVFDTYHRVQLRAGHDFFKRGFGPLFNSDGMENQEVLREMEMVWRDPSIRETVLQDDFDQHGPFHRPYSWWKFEKKIDPPHDKDGQKKWLIEHPEFLTNEEKGILQ